MSEEQKETKQPLFGEPGADQDAILAQLARLRDMTRRTGTLFEPQMLQLRYWPQVLFPVSEHTIEVDDDERIITVTMRLSDALPSGDDLVTRIETFETWLWELLGEEWLLRLKTRQKRGGKAKVLHRGRRKSTFQPAKQPEGAITEFRRYRPDKTKLALDDDPSSLPPIFQEKK